MSLSCWLPKTSDKNDAKEVNKRIEQEIKNDKKIARNQVKLLVLGTSESGKSTFLKQMRIIHGSGYTDEERLTFVSLISRNIQSAMRTIIKSMEYLNIEFENEENKKIAEPYNQETEEDDESHPKEEIGKKYITKEMTADFERLWKDGGVQRCYSRRDEFHLSDSTGYFMSNLDRITEKGYIPSLQDILRSRMPTSGIREYQFDIGSFGFGIVDVGGQKSERRKWIHCFENVTSIIFLAALSEYNMTIPLEEVSQEIQISIRQNGRRRALRSKKPPGGPGTSGFANGFDSSEFANGGSSHRKRNGSRKKIVVMSELPKVSTLPKNFDSPDQNGNMRKQSNDSSQSESTYSSPAINRMKESRALFKTIICSEYFQNTSVILFLNKKDILAEKVKLHHISDHFPEFTGPKCDADAARNFILTKYADCFERRRTPKRDLYAHFTCATDTRNIKYVFAAVKDIILKNYLFTYNLV